MLIFPATLARRRCVLIEERTFSFVRCCCVQPGKTELPLLPLPEWDAGMGRTVWV